MWLSRAVCIFVRWSENASLIRWLLNWDRAERKSTCMKERQGHKTAGKKQTKPSSLAALCLVCVWHGITAGEGKLTRVFKSNGPWFSSKYQKIYYLLNALCGRHWVWYFAAVSKLNKFSVQFACSVVSNSLWPHGLQHTRPPCPSPTLRVYSSSCPLNWWCHPTISSSVIPFSSCLQLSQHQGLVKWVSSLHQEAKILEFQLQHQSYQWTTRTDLL